VTIVRSDVGEQIAQRTADAYRGLPQAQRDRTVVFGESYSVAAYLRLLHALPVARGIQRQPWLRVLPAAGR
jgi:hypothetical protein